MKWFIMAALAVVGGLIAPATAGASEGFTTADVNMRAGPSTEYPRIIVLPRGAPVEIYGCVRGYTWCDVGYYRDRGWVSSRYLSVFYDSRQVYVPYTPRVQVPIITFDFGYWDTWYPRYPWYRDYRWRRTYPTPEYYRERRRNDEVVIYPRERRDRIVRPRVDRNVTPQLDDRRDRFIEPRERRDRDRTIRRDDRPNRDAKRERLRDRQERRQENRRVLRYNNNGDRATRRGEVNDCVVIDGRCAARQR